MIRYYLLPAVPNLYTGQIEPDIETGIKPKYLNQISAVATSVKALLAEEVARDGLGKRQWLRNHYILRIDAPDGTDWTQLDSQPDVIHITRQILINNITTLQSLGIDTTGLTINTPRKAIERRLNQWLHNNDNDFESAFAVPGAVID